MAISNTIQSIDVLNLTDDTKNVYKSIAILGTRSNQIGSKLKAELNEKLAEFATHGDSLEEVVENREQIEIAKQYEAMPKPTLLALHEFMQHKTYFEETQEG